jgi:hypothetical protein
VNEKAIHANAPEKVIALLVEKVLHFVGHGRGVAFHQDHLHPHHGKIEAPQNSFWKNTVPQNYNTLT